MCAPALLPHGPTGYRRAASVHKDPACLMRLVLATGGSRPEAGRRRRLHELWRHDCGGPATGEQLQTKARHKLLAPPLPAPSYTEALTRLFTRPELLVKHPGEVRPVGSDLSAKCCCHGGLKLWPAHVLSGIFHIVTLGLMTQIHSAESHVLDTDGLSRHSGPKVRPPSHYAGSGGRPVQGHRSCCMCVRPAMGMCWLSLATP